MSIYVRFPTCWAILSDKELLFIKFKEQLETKNLSEEEKKKEIQNFLMNTPFNNMCCRMRIYTACDYAKIIV